MHSSYSRRQLRSLSILFAKAQKTTSMEESWVRIIAKFSAYIIILPSILAVWRFRNGDREQRILSLLIFISVLFEFACLIVGSVFHQNNLIYVHIFTVIEFGFLAYIFKPSAQKVISEKGVLFSIAGFTVFAILNSIFFESTLKYNAFARAIEGVLIIFFILVYFYTLLKSLEIKSLESAPLFWIAVGTLLYFSGGLFIFIFSNYVLPFGSTSLLIWAIHAFLSIVLNLFYTLALWVNPKL